MAITYYSSTTPNKIHAVLMKETLHSTTPQPKVQNLTEVRDVKSWLSLKEFHGHSTPHCFKFVTLSSSGSVKMFFKRWSSDLWCTDEEAVSVLEVSINFTHNVLKLVHKTLKLLPELCN